MAKIVVVEDEENIRYSVRRSLGRAGHEVAEADSLAPARLLIREHGPEIVITDLNLGGDNGLDLVRELRQEGYDGGIIVITAYGSVETAVAAMKEGADDFLQKPLSLEGLQVQVDRVLEDRRVRSRLDLYERMERQRQSSGTPLLGSSPAWRDTVKLAEKFARLPVASGGIVSAILLLGETGVGKGVVARHIHDVACAADGGEAAAEGRRGGRGQEDAAASGSEAAEESPFVHVNCTSLPATLIESELFGHEKGAFTDARAARRGLFELADGGTIFLDEIGDMPLELQSKLLIVVEKGVFRRIGGSSERKVRARIIAATNHDLAQAVAAGRFRQDLYYRLNALTVLIPPLRHRQDDAVEIAASLLDRAARQLRRPALRLSDSAVHAIRRHSWPGNVRELANAVHRAALLVESDVVDARDLGLIHESPAWSAAGSAAAAPKPTAGPALATNGHATVSTPATPATPATPGPTGGLDAHAASGAAPAHEPEELQFDFRSGRFTAEAVERQLIVSALRHVHGNVSRASKMLGMNRSSLRYRIERYQLEEFVQELTAR